MGSLVSMVKANLYVEDFEEKALVSAPCTSKIWSMRTTSLISPCLERLVVFFLEEG